MHLSELDTKAKFIAPEIKKSEWEEFVIREHNLTNGRKLFGGKRGSRLFVGYLLKYKNVNLVIIEAKRFENPKALKESILNKAFNEELKENILCHNLKHLT